MEVCRSIPNDKAREVVESLEQKMTADFASEVATEAEFAAVRGEMKAEFATLRSEMKAEFATVRSEMKALTFDITTRMGVLYVTATSFLLAVLKFT